MKTWPPTNLKFVNEIMYTIHKGPQAITIQSNLPAYLGNEDWKKHFALIKVNIKKDFSECICKQLQPVTKYLRLTLVFTWNSALQEKFNFNFLRVFC